MFVSYLKKLKFRVWFVDQQSLMSGSCTVPMLMMRPIKAIISSLHVSCHVERMPRLEGGVVLMRCRALLLVSVTRRSHTSGVKSSKNNCSGDAVAEREVC